MSDQDIALLRAQTNYGRHDHPQPRPSARIEVSLVAARYNLTLADLQRRDSRRRVAWPRQHAMSVLRDRNWSLPKIAAFFNLSDHTTVLWGLRAHAKRVADAG
jgi:chromosomal replication initiation ATPase DnaA